MGSERAQDDRGPNVKIKVNLASLTNIAFMTDVDAFVVERSHKK